MKFEINKIIDHNNLTRSQERELLFYLNKNYLVNYAYSKVLGNENKIKYSLSSEIVPIHYESSVPAQDFNRSFEELKNQVYKQLIINELLMCLSEEDALNLFGFKNDKIKCLSPAESLQIEKSNQLLWMELKRIGFTKRNLWYGKIVKLIIKEIKDSMSSSKISREDVLDLLLLVFIIPKETFTALYKILMIKLNLKKQPKRMTFLS